MKFRKSKNQSETSEVESYPVYENLGEIIDVTLCPKVNVSRPGVWGPRMVLSGSKAELW